MKFIVKSDYIRDRYVQLTNIKAFSNTVSENKYKRIRYVIGLFIAAIYAFMVGYSMYYWGEDNLKDLFMQFIMFSTIFVVFIYLLQIIRDIIQASLLSKQKYEPTICIFNKFYCLSTLQYEHSVSKGKILTTLIAPFVLFSLLPLLLVTLGIENKVLLALSYSNAVLSIADVVQAIYIAKYLPNDSLIDLGNSPKLDKLENTNQANESKSTFTKVYNTPLTSQNKTNKSNSTDKDSSTDDELIIAVNDLNKSFNVIDKAANKSQITQDTLSNTIIIEELKELIAPLNENELSCIVRELKK